MAKKQKLLHILTELFAIVFIVPYLLFISLHFKGIHKLLLIFISLSTLVVDSYLLFTWTQEENGIQDFI